MMPSIKWDSLDMLNAMDAKHSGACVPYVGLRGFAFNDQHRGFLVFHQCNPRNIGPHAGGGFNRERVLFVIVRHHLIPNAT